MNLKVLIRSAEEGGFWGEVPALPGCYSQGETVPDLPASLREAILCHLDLNGRRFVIDDSPFSRAALE